MRTVPYHIILIGLFACLCAQAQETPSDTWTDLGTELSSRASGSGLSTGQIGTIYVRNASEEDITIRAQHFLIPSSGTHQGYLARIPAGLTAKGNATTEIPILGYCTDGSKPAVPIGSPLPALDQWQAVKMLTNADQRSQVALLPQSPELPPFQLEQIAQIEASKAFKKTRKTGEWELKYPNSEQRLAGTFQIDEAPDLAAPLLQAYLQLLEARYDQLASQDLVRTPMSGDALRERETILQHAIWIITAQVRGQAYNYEDFATLAETTLQEASLITESTRQEAAIKTLWATFHRLIYQAGLSSQLPEEVAQFPTLIEMPAWEQLNLTPAYRKPGLLLPTSAATQKRTFKGLWLPVIGGIAAGSGLTYVLLNEETEPPVDTTTIITPVFDSIRLTDDTFTLDCLPPATIFPLENDQGVQLQISSVSAAGGATVTILGTDAIVISDFGGQSSFSFDITVTDSLGNNAVSTVDITINLPEISAVDDNYNTAYATPFSANVLSNDSGQSLEILTYTPPPSGASVNLQADGTLMLSPAPDFTGTLSLEYIIQDACLQQDTASVTVEVGSPDCTFSAEIISTAADCGYANGSLEAQVSPMGTYSYAWSNGDTTAIASDLTTGAYSLTISSNSGLCEQSYNTSVAENPVSYISSITSGPGDCTGGGQIVLDLSTPEADPFTIDWTGPGGANSTTATEGVTNLGEQFNLLPGSYNFTIYPTVAGETCAESATIEIPDTTLSLVAIADQFSTPYETSLSGNLLLNDSGQSIVLTSNTAPAVGNLNITSNGQFNYTPPADYTGTVSFSYTISDACGNEQSAMVSIEIGAPNCAIGLSLTPIDSDCGLDNGSITSVVTPDGEYNYNWSTGATTSQVSDLPPGTYSLTVSSEGGLCEESASASIAENPIDYLLSSSIVPGNCLGEGNIILELQSPDDLPLSLEITANGQSSTFEVAPGTIELNTLINISAGNYIVNVYPTAAGFDCRQLQSFVVPDNTPMLNVMGETYSTAFQTPFNGNLLSNDGGLNIELTSIMNLTGGVIDFQANGDFFFVPFNDFTSEASFNYIVTDACGNSSMGTVTIDVGEPDCNLSVNFTTVAADCGYSTGSISTMVSPEGAYTYAWSTGANTPDISQVAAGEYLLTITSNSGVCNEIFSALVIELAPDYFVSSSTSPATCTGGGNITLELSSPDNGDFGGVIVGPGLNQTLSLSSGVNQLNESLNLLPGGYTITIYSLTAGFRCNQSINVEITDNTPALSTIADAFSTDYETALSSNFMTNDSGLDLSAISVSAVNNGTLDFDATGNFTITPDDGFAGITGFTYTVMDACGQTSSADVIITVSPPSCDFSVELTVFNAVCGLPNGMITTTVIPDGIYTYEWSNGATSSSISDLMTGAYMVTVTDETGFCTQQAEATIINGPPVFIDSLSTAPGNCAGDGSIIIEAYAPGNSTLDVLINGPNGSDLITINSGFSDLGDLVNLPSGVYDLVIYPTAVGLSCSEETFAIIDDDTPPIIVNDDNYFTPFQSPLVNNVLLNDEGLLLEVTSVGNFVGGTVEMATNGDFVFTPNNGATGVASFTYTAMDACTDQQEGLVTITIGPDNCNFDLLLNVNDASCGFPDGSIAAVTTPPGDYSYSWSNGATTSSIENLGEGIYSVTVIDNVDGCPLSLQDTIVENATNYISNLMVAPADCDEDASIELTLSSSYPGLYTLLIDPPSGGQQTLDNLPPGPVQLQNFLIIESGTYQISAYNQNIGQSCTDSVMAVVPEATPSPMIMLSNIMLPSGPGSMDGSFEVAFTSLSLAPYTININGQDVGQSDGSNFLWGGLNPGTYDVFATDANGCTSNIASVTLSSTTAIRVGWAQNFLNFSLEEPEGPTNTLQLRGSPFLEIDFRRPKQVYRLRMQEWRIPNDPLQRSRAVLLGVQHVHGAKPSNATVGNSSKNRWTWSNGLALLQYRNNNWYWHSSLEWRPKFIDGMQLGAQFYAGKNSNLQLGLQWHW